MAVIEKKTWSELFERVLSGTKNFDLRLADFACEPGDILLLREYDPKTGEYTGRSVEKKITYVMKLKPQDFYKKEDIDKYGLQIISF